MSSFPKPLRLPLQPSFLLLSLLALIAAAQSIYFLLFYRKGVYIDQWDLVPILDAYFSRGDWFSLSLTQHGGHFHTAAYLIMLPLAKLSHWNLFYETVVIVCINLLSFWLLYLVFLNNITYKTKLCVLVSIIFTLLYFSFGHGGNALWSWQLCVYLCVFGWCVILYAFSLENFGTTAFSAALVGGLIATFSYSCGFAVWPIGTMLILLRNSLTIRVRLIFTCLWLLVGSTVTLYYLQNMHNTGMNEGFQFDLNSNVLFLIYYLGTPIAYFSRDFSIVVALIGLVVFTYLSVKLSFRVTSKNRNWLLLVLALAAFSILSGILISVGRIEFGVDQARSFRYLIFSQFFWFSLLLLVWLNNKTNRSTPPKSTTWLLYLMLIMVIFTSQKTGRSNIQVAQQDNLFYQQVAESAPTQKSALLTQLSYPPSPMLMQYLNVLESYKLNYYHSE